MAESANTPSIVDRQRMTLVFVFAGTTAALFVALCFVLLQTPTKPKFDSLVEETTWLSNSAFDNLSAARVVESRMIMGHKSKTHGPVTRYLKEGLYFDHSVSLTQDTTPDGKQRVSAYRLMVADHRPTTEQDGLNASTDCPALTKVVVENLGLNSGDTSQIVEWIETCQQASDVRSTKQISGLKFIYICDSARVRTVIIQPGNKKH